MTSLRSLRPQTVLTTPVPVSVSDMREPVILQEDKRLASDLHETLGDYIQRNVSYEIQKALAIHIMVSAVLKWNSTISEAAEHASDCST